MSLDAEVAVVGVGTAGSIEVLDRAAMAHRYPQHATLPGEVGVFDPQAGFLRSDAAVLTAAARAESLGARVLRLLTRLRPAQTGSRDDSLSLVLPALTTTSPLSVHIARLRRFVCPATAAAPTRALVADATSRQPAMTSAASTCLAGRRIRCPARR